MPYCRQCGKEVNAGETFCRFCGAKLNPVETGSQNPYASSAVKEEDIALFIGKNAEKYLGKFRKFTQNGEDSFAATWHWPAFFFSFWWTLYRKLYGWAFLVFFLGCVPYLGLLVMIAFGMSANYIYYRHAKKKLIEVKSLPASEVERAAAAAIVIFGILAAIAIPQFNSYRQRSFDLKAKHEIQDACSRAIAFFEARPEIAEIAPDDFLDSGLVRSPEVELMLLDGRRESFSLSAHHKKGSTLYLTDKQCTLTEEKMNRVGTEQTKF
jgi:Tfp pilus assembly protein PilE